MNTRPGQIPDELLLAYFEDALPPDESMAIAERLADDPKALATLAEWRRQNDAIETLFAPVAKEPIPARHLNVLRPVKNNSQYASRPSPRLATALRLAAMLGLLAIGAAGGWFAAQNQPRAPHSLAEAAINAHLTYVSEVIHPVEVEASQAAHLTGWVSNRLGRDIATPDFAVRGFQLIGGRILPGDTGAAAMFMYENEQGQRVTLYVAPPSSGKQTAFQFAEVGGMQSFYWMDGTLNYAVVGDIRREDLRRIALDAYDQLT